MEEDQDNYISDEVDSIEPVDDGEVSDFLKRKDMLKKVYEVPFEARRVFLEWKVALDEDGKKYDKPVKIAICDLSTKHLNNILKWSGYDFETNTDLALHTIKEEYIYRLKHG